MIEAMQQGEDLHRMTAAKIFGVSEAAVTKEQRQQAKAVNFGLIYGMSPNRLVKDGIAKDQQQGAAIIRSFFELYLNIKRMHKNEEHRQAYLAALQERGFHHANMIERLVLKVENGEM